MTKQNIIPALPEVILEQTEGFLQKGFKWKNIPMLSVITGVNGSGKTQLLEWIYNVRFNQNGYNCHIH